MSKILLYFISYILRTHIGGGVSEVGKWQILIYLPLLTDRLRGPTLHNTRFFLHFPNELCYGYP